MTKVGSSPSREHITETMDVVVVFPWVPATATLRLPRISAASTCAREKIGMSCRCASFSSTLPAGIAADTTTASGRPTWRRR